MPSARLIRVSRERTCTRGVLLVDGAPVCVTLEPPWADNKRHVSSIPIGFYRCVWTGANSRFTAGRGFTYLVSGVPGRTDILLHCGNYPRSTRGCILLGSSFQTLPDGSPAIRDSRAAFLKFLSVFKTHEPFTLEIGGPYAGAKGKAKKIFRDRGIAYKAVQGARHECRGG